MMSAGSVAGNGDDFIGHAELSFANAPMGHADVESDAGMSEQETSRATALYEERAPHSPPDSDTRCPPDAMPSALFATMAFSY